LEHDAILTPKKLDAAAQNTDPSSGSSRQHSALHYCGYSHDLLSAGLHFEARDVVGAERPVRLPIHAADGTEQAGVGLEHGVSVGSVDITYRRVALQVLAGRQLQSSGTGQRTAAACQRGKREFYAHAHTVIGTEKSLRHAIAIIRKTLLR
jgi:hypothetical protein